MVLLELMSGIRIGQTAFESYEFINDAGIEKIIFGLILNEVCFSLNRKVLRVSNLKKIAFGVDHHHTRRVRGLANIRVISDDRVHMKIVEISAQDCSKIRPWLLFVMTQTFLEGQW